MGRCKCTPTGNGVTSAPRKQCEVAKAINECLPDHELLPDIVQLAALLQAWRYLFCLVLPKTSKKKGAALS